jgi:hypothetical protein
MHVTLRASSARGSWSLLQKKNRRFVDDTIAKAGRRWGVKVYEKANAGNHLHLLLKAQTRRGFANFLRVLGAQIALFVTGAKRGETSASVSGISLPGHASSKAISPKPAPTSCKTNSKRTASFPTPRAPNREALLT